ncbi:hypothetical protein [Burkholderia pyrrocinia]|uniref:hypothetical protein n=1 Tax=Burkholderia pyrrocinia TaxID=60550 RepID=UPI00158B485B|nr:hypothetical protein [Burkholderia pyrrocinia]
MSDLMHGILEYDMSFRVRRNEDVTSSAGPDYGGEDVTSSAGPDGAPTVYVPSSLGVRYGPGGGGGYSDTIPYFVQIGQAPPENSLGPFRKREFYKGRPLKMGVRTWRNDTFVDAITKMAISDVNAYDDAPIWDKTLEFPILQAIQGPSRAVAIEGDPIVETGWAKVRVWLPVHGETAPHQLYTLGVATRTIVRASDAQCQGNIASLVTGILLQSAATIVGLALTGPVGGEVKLASALYGPVFTVYAPNSVKASTASNYSRELFELNRGAFATLYSTIALVFCTFDGLYKERLAAIIEKADATCDMLWFLNRFPPDGTKKIDMTQVTGMDWTTTYSG